jgi:hypothetical protein
MAAARMTRSDGCHRGNLAFEDAELITGSEDLGAELGLGVAADDQDVEHEAD